MRVRHVVASAALGAGAVLVFACSSSNPGFSPSLDDGGAPGPTDATAGPGRDGSTPFADAPPLIGDDASKPVGSNDASLYNDGGLPDVVSDGACLSPDAGVPPYVQRCAPATANECDGATDTWLGSHGVSASLANGPNGNGFDDDCDGLVDEQCPCTTGNGTTKTCYLVPPTQADPGTGQPVGWCTENSKGSLDCAGAEFPRWSGVCRGAQPPYPDDVCAPGDFNCDGLPENSHSQDCTCKPVTVQCPAAPVTEAPYPPPNAIQLIDGSQWISDPAARTRAKAWTWTVIGGDCDNVLPHPTYAVYKQTDSTVAGARVGARTPVKYDAAATPPRYVAAAGQPLVSIQTSGYGDGVAGGQVYPAFGLSGDYIVQGEFDLDGQHYVCTQKVQVRAPGIRAELCWDTVGGEGAVGGNDIDLHFAQLQYDGAATGCATNGFEDTCQLGATYQDCWYDGISGCRDTSFSPPDWHYAQSADAACIGWSSKRHPKGGQYYQTCTNPRLDKDNIECDTSVDDPTAQGSGLPLTGEFCGPENINLDDPKDNDAFVVAVNHYATHKASNGNGTNVAHPHVNLYCNGQRVLSVGYNPVTGMAAYPALLTPGTDSTGDYWIVGTIKAHVANGQLTTCDVATIPSHDPDPTRDGASDLCVESTKNASTPAYPYTSHAFDEHPALQVEAAGAIPQQPAHWCKH